MRHCIAVTLLVALVISLISLGEYTRQKALKASYEMGYRCGLEVGYEKGGSDFIGTPIIITRENAEKFSSIRFKPEGTLTDFFGFNFFRNQIDGKFYASREFENMATIPKDVAFFRLAYSGDNLFLEPVRFAP